MQKEKLIILCDLGVGGERGRVFSPKGKSCAISATEYKDPAKVVKRWKRNVIRSE